MSDIEERVKKIVVEHLGVEESKIQSDSKFIDDLGADSLDTVELDRHRSRFEGVLRRILVSQRRRFSIDRFPMHAVF